MPLARRRTRAAGAALLILLLAPVAAALSAAPSAPAPEAARFFESRIRPLLLERCTACHGPRLQQGGLRVDTRAGLLKGGARGPALVPGQPEQSLLLRAVRHADPALKMPPAARLADAEIAALAAWVKMGSPWPAAGAPSGSAEAHWAYRPVADPGPPAVKDRAWVRSPLDAFLLARLEAQGLKPAPAADRRTLLRRVTFDLTGLPPTPDEVAAFLADRAPDAWEKVVDRLLASPRYGEKWGRHWLDAARYADSNGLDENYHYAHAWRYRDWVIDAFNRDLPYDRFLVHQLAGDLLPPVADPEEGYRRLTATGFWLLGPKLLANPDKEQVLADIIDEQIDVASRAMLGVTLACARCHDHKFDPFTQRDYYAMAGILRSTRSMVSLKERRWMERPLAPAAVAARFEAHRKALDESQKALAEARRKRNPDASALAALEARVAELERSRPPAVPYALAVEDGPGEDTRLFIRGDHNRPGETVPRGFPTFLAGGRQPRLDAGRSGRLELAAWIASPANPLTARVLVNRVWQGHFGEGLVRTPDNFGRLGEKPSHPELLDWLARRFMERDWSVKALHREILRSSAYRMSAAFDARAHREDPDNRLLWRMNRRRLTAEEQRDAMLFAADALDPTPGGTLLEIPNMERVTNDGSSDLAAGSYAGRRRTIYLPVVRNSLFEMLELFDFGDPSAVTARRSETIAAPQALFMLNHPLMLENAGRLAERLLARPGGDAARVEAAYLRLFARPSRPGETAAALAFLRDAAPDRDPEAARLRAWRGLCHTLFCANEFLYVE